MAQLWNTVGIVNMLIRHLYTQIMNSVMLE